MSRHLGASILLASKDPDRLRSFYCEAFGVEPDQYHSIDLGGLGIIFDSRGDIAERTSEPRIVLNVDTEDARSVVEHIEEMGVRFSVRLEDRGPGIFSTFEDPDGNLVQVLQMTQEYRDSLSR
jgi:predicted enzyme related to lactoylglutathione lyase